jgi:NDP-sugar pyrophosphorylase family protein
MMAVILAGGKGTRLKPFTMTIPKPLLPLGEVPILEVVIRQLAGAGVKRVVVTLGHMAHLFIASIGQGSRWGVEIEYCVEEEPLGTAGSLRLVNGLDDDFLVMNGDLLTTIDYAKLFAFHRQHRAGGTIAVHERQVHIDYGVVVSGADAKLSEYREKPTISYEVSMGINILSKRCLAHIPKAGKFDMPELMLAMRGKGEPVMCFKTDCYWQDIGRFDDYQRASEDFNADQSRFFTAGRA